METFRFDGFRPWLEKATRVDDDRDWSVHTVDYAGFKRRLLEFSKRRAKLRHMLRAGPDDTITQMELDSVLGQQQHNAVPPTLTVQPNTAEGDSSFVLGYIPFVESSSSRSLGSIEIKKLSEPQGSCEDLNNSSFFFFGERRHKRRSVMRRVSNTERNELFAFLAWEVDKVAMFYLSQWQRLSQLLLDANSRCQERESQQLGSASLANDPALVALAEELLELEAFIIINILCVRQILIRYDAFARTFEGTPVLHYYMKKMLKFSAQTSFRKILHHAELKALADSFATACADNASLLSRFMTQRRQFELVLESSQRAEATSSSGHVAIQDNLLQTLQYYFLLGLIEDRLGYEPSYLLSRGKSLTEEMRILADWRNRGNKFYSDINIGEDDAESATLTPREIFNLVMALLAAFFYCMNYYIVEPSSTMYVNALGAHDAMSGTLIGMMPLASFTSAIVYSMWTNHSFRHPFLVSGVLLVTGNILYSAAFNFRSINLALAGRFLTGLGGPKCIIRRYMADTTSLSLRTSVNAGFGMVVAAGSALGPGCAILLNKLNYVISIPNGTIPLNGMTGPGYFMATLWTLFTLALFIFFQEPDRSGLEEQKRLEAARAGKPKTAQKDPNPALPEYIVRQDMETTGLQQDFSEHPNLEGVGTSVDLGNPSNRDDDLMTIFSGTTQTYREELIQGDQPDGSFSCWSQIKQFFRLVTFPVRICLGLLLAKVFVIEALVSATSALTKNRYRWHVQQVGTLGCINGFTVIPLSVLIGRLSMSYQDRVLMIWLLSIGIFGLFLLIDISDLIGTPTNGYNEGHFLAVNPKRYVLGYFLAYISIQSFEGVIGSTLSKVIPTALASGTINSGLLATLVDTFGRACGDLFISLVGFINLRQLMNLLFIPGITILLVCLTVVRKYYDILAV